MNGAMTRIFLCTCIIALCICAIPLCGCTIEKAPPAGPSSDNFERPDVGAGWKQTGPGYRIVNGELVVDHALNHPLWLAKPIPRDCIVELDVWSNDDAGDIKLEAWGDGHSYATQASYTATSYVFIFGGWSNTISAIARMNELLTEDMRVRCNPELVVGYGRAADELQRVVHERAVDLVVLGVRRRTLIDRVVFGSTTQGLIRHGACTVLTVNTLESAQRR